MRPLFFSNRIQKPARRFLKSAETLSTAETVVSSGQHDSSGILSPINSSYKSLRLFPPKETAEEKLEKLLIQIRKCEGLARCDLLKDLENFFIKNPTLVNMTPKKSNYNPLELVLGLDEIKLALKLIGKHAIVRPENRDLLKKVKQLLPNHNEFKKKVMEPSFSYKV